MIDSGLPRTVCNWVLDFLFSRPQSGTDWTLNLLSAYIEYRRAPEVVLSLFILINDIWLRFLL